MTTNDFTKSDYRICVRDDNDCRQLFNVSEAAAKWDGSSSKLAIECRAFSDKPIYAYARITITARKVRRGYDDQRNRVTCRVEFEKTSTDLAVDFDGFEEAITCELILPVTAYDNADSKELLAKAKHDLEIS